MGQIDRYKNVQTDNEGCGRLCESIEECCSYEFSPNEKLCNLNRDCKPNAEKHKDYIFCSKKDKAGESMDEESDDPDYGIKVHGSVVGSDMFNAGEHEVEVHGNIMNSNIENYGSNKYSDLPGERVHQLQKDTLLTTV